MDNFTPIASTLGGMLIGLAAISMMHFQGRILGVSGIYGTMFKAPKADTAWRVAFALGVILVGAAIATVSPGMVNNTLDQPVWMVGLAGLLVGVGTRLGSGCTSGHGICGISRLSPRSLIATCTFMLTGGIATYIFQHAL